jgi:SAM-dependent methyltransferase
MTDQGILMANPLHTPKTKDQYSDPAEQALYEYFTKTLGWGEALHSRASFEFLIEARNFSKGKTILDAGAGSKRFEPFFREATYLTLEHPSGIEMKQMQGISYDFVCELDRDNFAPKEESVDAIYSHSVLEHIERPEKFFANAMKVLKPGGRLFIHCPFTYLEHETPYDFNRFTRYGLRSRLEAAGFRVVKLLPSSNAVYGATAFVLDSIRNEGEARGSQLECIALPDGQSFAVGPLLASIIKTLNSAYDDAIYDNNLPIGWLCVAEKV